VWRAPPTGKPLAPPKIVLDAVALNLSEAESEVASASGESSSASASDAGSSGGAGSGSGSGPSLSASMCPSDDIETRRAKLAAVVAASKEGGWPLFMHNMMTFLWKTMYNKELPYEAVIPMAKLKKVMPHLSPEELAVLGTVRHTFTALA
jgi:hypothetical protein